MYNWNTDISQFQRDKEYYTVWKLNQMINYGLNGEKLDLKMVKKFWDKLDIDDKRKKFLSLILWGKLS